MRHLVLADDSTTIQKVIQLSFAGEDFEIHNFTNGTSALEYLRSYGCDVVLADISLPHLDGYDLCREIRQDPRTAGLPVVLLAGTFEPFDAERALEVGYTSLLVKPFETGKLVDLVKKLASRPAKKASPSSVTAKRVDKGGSNLSGEVEKKPELEQTTFHPAIKVPVPAASGEILFELSPRQCRLEETKVRAAAVGPELSPEQLDELVEKVIERLPATLRSLVPDIARELLSAPLQDSEVVCEDPQTERT